MAVDAEAIESSVLTAPSRAISGFWRRACAFVLDGCFLGVIGSISGFALYGFYAGLGGWGRLIGFAVALAYFGVFNSSLGKGATFGKRLMGIEVVDAKGNPISLARSLARYCVLGVPYFLNGAPIRLPGPPLLGGTTLSLIILGVGGFDAYLLVFNRRTRQSLHDLLVGTYVTRVGGSGAPHIQPLWRGHLAIAGIWCVAALGLGAVGPLVFKIRALQEILVVQRKLETLENVGSATVNAVGGWASNNGTSVKVSSLDVSAAMKMRPPDYEREARTLAAAVLAVYPKILERDTLGVTVSYGYDIGISKSSISETFKHRPQEWMGLIGAAK